MAPGPTILGRPRVPSPAPFLAILAVLLASATPPAAASALPPPHSLAAAPGSLPAALSRAEIESRVVAIAVGTASGVAAVLIILWIVFCVKNQGAHMAGEMSALRNRKPLRPPTNWSEAKMQRFLAESAAEIDEAAGKEACPVCLEDLGKEGGVVALECGHAFHKKCLHAWLVHGSSTCPTCQKAVEDDGQG